MKKDDATVHTVLGFKVWSYPASPKPEWTPAPNSAAHISKKEWFGTWQDRMLNMHIHIQKFNKEENGEDKLCPKKNIKK